MSEEEAKKEQFEFTPEGEALGYISLEQARVLAMEHARANLDFYGPRYRRVELAHEVTTQDEGEDYYDIKLSFRPSGRFRGEPGVEQFIIDKIGTIRIRQVLDEPSDLGHPAGKRPPVWLMAAGGIAIAGVVAVIISVLTGSSNGTTPIVAPAPTSSPIAAVSDPTPTAASQTMASQPAGSTQFPPPKSTPISMVSPASAPIATQTATGIRPTVEPTSVPSTLVAPFKTPVSPTATPIPTPGPQTINEPRLDLSSAVVLPSQTLSIIASGFTPGGRVNDPGNTTNRISIDGVAILKEAINFGTIVNIDERGGWDAPIIIPINSATTSPGNHELEVVDSAGRRTRVTLIIPPRTLALEPPAGRPGTAVKITGGGFPAYGPRVRINYNLADVSETVATLTPDQSGSIRGTFEVPIDTPIPSMATVTADFRVGPATISAVASHSVPQSQITVDPTQGPPGTLLTIRGSGFATFTTIGDLRLAGIDIRPAPTPSTNGEGRFTAIVVVPGIAPLTADVTITAGTATARDAFDVTRSPTLPDYPLPTNNPAITILPANGVGGTEVTIIGSGFPGFSILSELEIGRFDVRPAPVPTIDALGNFTVKVLVPFLNSGGTVVSATANGITAKIFFTVDPQ